MKKNSNLIYIVLIGICALILLILFNNDSITKNNTTIKTQVIEETIPNYQNKTTSVEQKIEYISYGKYLGYEQETTNTSTNYKECLVTIQVDKKIATGTILDSYNGKTIISTAAHVFHDETNKDTFFVKITFYNGDTIEINNFVPIFSKSNEDVSFILCDYTIENKNNIKAINFDIKIENNKNYSLGENFYFANYCYSNNKKFDYLATPYSQPKLPLFDVNGGTFTIYMTHYENPDSLKGTSGCGVFNKDGLCIGFVYMHEKQIVSIVPISKIIEDLNNFKNNI